MTNQSHLTLGSEPTKAAGRVGGYHLLNRNNINAASNLGGKFALPIEFDSTVLAGGFYAEGQEALAMESPQPMLGTPYTAPGWSVWKYPDTVTGSKPPQPHTYAGKPHRVAGTKAGENFILMCRPLDVQHQVNSVYGELSTDMMVSEIKGETNLAQGGDPGILINSRLNTEIGKDQEIEENLSEGTRQTVAHSGPVRRPEQRVKL